MGARLRKFNFLFFLLFLFLFVAPGKVIAYPMDTGAYPTSCTGTCSDPAPSACYTSVAGSCAPCTGNSDCCSRGVAWHRYAPECRRITYEFVNGVWVEQCRHVWVMKEDCNTADSCVGTEHGLRSGQCGAGCPIGGTIYKHCCNATRTGTITCNGGDHTGTCPYGYENTAAECSLPTPTPGGPTNTPAPAWCAYSCILNGSCPAAQQRSGACTSGNECCELGDPCGICCSN